MVKNPPMILDEEATVMIVNSKCYRFKFRTIEEAIKYVEGNCPHLWTKLLRKVEGRWIVCGSILPQTRD